ncbi:MAG: histidine--tRNA ligase [Pikeienuella sp.]|uniref:histidine--tRNA ligase n=1 Tax=Pikeienuella sp. TaxID=2831957 RepID=UPI003919222A
MAKEKKPRRPKAETPRGFRDYFGAEVTERAEMLRAITGVYHRYGFDPLETSAVETLEALGKFLPDVDRPNEGVFAWRDEDESWMALRYDLTAPLARVYAEHQLHLPTPYRRYAVGPVWRNEKPGPGRFRQFYQCDADTVGAASPAADAEICAMLADALEAAGIARGDYVIRINNRKVLNGVMEVVGLLDPADPEAGEAARGVVLRAIDKLDRLGEAGVRALLGEGRKDESGDFTKGAGLAPEQINRIMSFVGASKTVDKMLIDTQAHFENKGSGGTEHFRTLRDAGDLYARRKLGISSDVSQARNYMMTEILHGLVEGSQVGEDGVQELETIAQLLDAQGYADRALIDPSVVRGLGYYTGPVFEAELTFEITDEEGRRRQFGSVAGGGRYDDLVMRFTGQRTPGTGVSIGVDRLLAALREVRRGTAQAEGPVLVTVMEKDRLAEYQAMTAELRAAGLRAEMFLGGGNMAKQLKYADRRGSPVAIIEGSEERARGVVQLKDLALGARLAAEIETNEEWKAQPAQMEAPRAGLVEAVKAMIARGA